VASVTSQQLWDRSMLDEAVPLTPPPSRAASPRKSPTASSPRRTSPKHSSPPPSSWDHLTILAVPGLFTKW
jgi:hypothetical protein